jgi:hypothetical protein
MVYEVKRVRAVWDPSLSIPGTDRRGGWRCPEGTRYGGQITDRFGRQCGWGLVRRIANMVSNVGESLEDRDDRRRARRGGKRRVTPDATPELDTPDLNLTNDDSALAESLGEVIPTPEPPKPRTVKPRRVINVDAPEAVEPKPEPRPRRAPRRRPQGNLRPSEQRRMERELEQPGAPRTGLEEPSVEQVLTPEQASDAVPTEEFRPYVLRKYNEYARNVRKIREEGGDAGMLTRREWYALNKDNLRSAWKDVHGVDAPDSFEPPTPQPRRPRRRRQRAVEEAASTRSPSLRNDKEPVAVEPKPEPKMPSRPKKPSSVRPTGAQDKPQIEDPQVPENWSPNGEDRWNVDAWRIALIRDENDNFLRFVASTSDMRYAEGVSVDEVVMSMNSEDDLFNAPREVDWNNGLEAQGIFQISAYLNDQVIGKRVEILNDANNFPVAYGVAGDADFADFQMNVENNIQQARQTRQAIEKLIRDGNIRKQDFWLDRNDVARDMESVLDWLEEVEDAWLYVQSTNAEVNTPEIDLGSGWNKVGENKWEKGGIELELGFVNGEVVSGQIKNTASGEIFEQEFRADQSQVQNFVNNLYAMIGGPTFPSVVPPNAKKKPQLRKGRKPISEETKRILENTGNLQYFITDSNGQPAMVYGVGYRNAYEVAVATTNIIKEQIGLNNNARFGHITQARDGIVGYNERLAFIQEAANTAGLTDDDYFLLADNTTISIGEIKSNIVKAKEEVQRRFKFVRDNYWTEREREAFRSADVLERLLSYDFWSNGYQAREKFIAFMAMHDYSNFGDILNVRNADSVTPEQDDFLKKQSELPSSERNYEGIYMVIQSIGEKEHQYAYSDMEDSEISDLLGLPDDFDYGTMTGLDEAIVITEAKDLDASTELAMVARRLTIRGLENEELNKLMADFIRLDNERFYFKSLDRKLKARKNNLANELAVEQASFDRDQAISNFEILPEFEADNLNQLLTLAERAQQLLGGARDADRDQDFRNPAGAVGRAVVAIDEAMRGKSEDERLKLATDMLDSLSMDGQIKQLNDAIEKFKISPTRKQLKELRRQTLETIKAKATIDYLDQTITKLNAPHRLDLNKLDQLFNFIETRDAYNDIPEFLRQIFITDFDRYGSELATPTEVAEAIRARRAEIRGEFNLVPNSPNGIEQMEEMFNTQQSKVFDGKEDFIAVFNEVSRFVPTGEKLEDRARIQEIAARLSQVAKNVAVNALELEEIKRELHSKRSAVANRPIPVNPMHILFGGKPEDHANGINTSNVAERINSIAGEISDRKISKYISDLDDAFRQLQQFDDNEIIRFPQGDINVGDAKKAIQEASSAYQSIKISRTNNPEQAVFTPRISDKTGVPDSELIISPISQGVSEIPENDLALIVNTISDPEKSRDVSLALDALKRIVDIQKIENLNTFIYALNNKINDLNIRAGGMSDADRDALLWEVDNFLKENGGVGIDDIEYYTEQTAVQKMKADDALGKIRDMQKQLADGAITQESYDRLMVTRADEYTRYLQDYQERADRIYLYNWARAEFPKMVERKLRGMDMSDGDITEPLSDDEVETLGRKITNKIKKGIARRLDALQAHINDNYTLDNQPWNITPEVWEGMSGQERIDYLTLAYSPKMIKGSNGRTYSGFADVSNNGNGQYSLTTQFFEVDENGNKLRYAGYADRTINMRGGDGYVYNARMFITESPVDKGAGIQTVFNQHAFMFLNSIGVTKAKVSTASDGPYVWARIGFVDDNGLQSGYVENMRKALTRYKNIGGISIIQNDEEYRRVEALVRKHENDSDSVTHQDFIFAFEDNGDKFRALRIKEFFKQNMPLSGGEFIFGDQGVSRNPGDSATRIMDEINLN